MDKSSLIYIIRQEIINHQLNIKAVIQVSHQIII